jgi:type I restriction enzyme S subunit
MKAKRQTPENGHACPLPDSELENAPSFGSWKNQRIADLTVRTSQRNPATNPERRFTYIDISAVSNISFRITEPADLLGAEAPSRARKVVHAGDVLFATVRPTLKRVALVPQRLNDQIASTGYIVLRADPEKLDASYLYFRLLTDEFIARMRELERGASYPAVRDTDVLNEEIPIPPLHEQQKIAAVLGQVQRALEQQERLIALTTELKKTLLNRFFTKGLLGEPQKKTGIGPVPKTWRVSRLDEFCILQRGFDITKKEQAPGNVPVVSSGGIASYHNVAKVKGPGVVVGRKGTLGKVHYVDVDYWPHDTTLWVKDFKRNDPLFTSYFLKTLRFERYNSGASNPTLNRNTIHAELVAYPPKQEQEEIGRILKAVEDKARVHECKYAALTALFRTLLHQLMTAQIRVDHLNLPELETAVME